MLMRRLAAELGDKGITKNADARTPVGSAMILQVQGLKCRAILEMQVPAKRHPRTGEFAAAIKILASEAAGYINGHILNIDGGFMASAIIIH